MVEPGPIVGATPSPTLFYVDFGRLAARPMARPAARRSQFTNGCGLRGSRDLAQWHRLRVRFPFQRPRGDRSRTLNGARDDALTQRGRVGQADEQRQGPDDASCKPMVHDFSSLHPVSDISPRRARASPVSSRPPRRRSPCAPRRLLRQESSAPPGELPTGARDTHCSGEARDHVNPGLPLSDTPIKADDPAHTITAGGRERVLLFRWGAKRAHVRRGDSITSSSQPRTSKGSSSAT